MQTGVLVGEKRSAWTDKLSAEHPHFASLSYTESQALGEPVSNAPCLYPAPCARELPEVFLHSLPLLPGAVALVTTPE